MSFDSDLARVVKRATDQGFRVRQTERNHWQFYAPNKEDIVTTGGTPSDARSWANFMAGLKRAGYEDTDGPKTVMAAALEQASAAAVGPLETPPALQVARSGMKLIDVVSDTLRQHADRIYTVEELNLIVRSHGMTPGETSVSGALMRLVDRGAVRRLGRGQYRWEDGSGARPVVFAPAPAVQEHELPGTTTGDVDIDADLRALDEALVALAKLEAVIRRNRAIAARTADLKKLLARLE